MAMSYDDQKFASYQPTAKLASGCNVASNSTGEVKLPGSIESLAFAIDKANSLCNRIVSLAERLVGPEPEDAAATPVSPPPPYVFPALGHAASDLQRRAEYALYQIDRIERALP